MSATLQEIDFNDLIDLPDPEAGKIVIDEKRGVCTLHFGNCPYEVDLDQIQSKTDLLLLVRHLCGKVWMNTTRLKRLIDIIAEHKKFKLYGGET